jgi:SAM-dependent methyltransferase
MLAALSARVSGMATFWDEKFGGNDYLYGTRPNSFLMSRATLFSPGMRAAVPGDGEGRNGVWLAERGLDVLSVDSSAVGQAKARALAAERGVPYRTELADLTLWDWPRETFDAVVSVFCHLHRDHRQRVHRAMLDALKPGGIVVMEAFRPEQLSYRSGGPKDPDMLFSVAALAEDFAGAEFVHCVEALDSLDEGPLHRGPAATLQVVVRKA